MKHKSRNKARDTLNPDPIFAERFEKQYGQEISARRAIILEGSRANREAFMEVTAYGLGKLILETTRWEKLRHPKAYWNRRHTFLTAQRNYDTATSLLEQSRSPLEGVRKNEHGLVISDSSAQARSSELGTEEPNPTTVLAEELPPSLCPEQ